MVLRFFAITIPKSAGITAQHQNLRVVLVLRIATSLIGSWLFSFWFVRTKSFDSELWATANGTCFRPEAPEAATGSAVVDQATLRIGASCPGRKTLPTVRENGIHPVSGVDEDDTDIRSPSVRP